VTAPIELGDRAGRGVRWAILSHDEAREGRRPLRPHVTVPVTVSIGDRSFSLGDVPRWDELPDRVADKLLDAIAAELRGAIGHGATTITMYLDAFRILAYRDEIREAVRRTPLDIDSTGPVVRILRRRAGMTLTALATAMERSRGTVAAWEAGRSTKCHVGDVNRAGRALGYSGSALIMAIDWLDETGRSPLKVAEPVA
jgi:Helix-turn-helix domain